MERNLEKSLRLAKEMIAMHLDPKCQPKNNDDLRVAIRFIEAAQREIGENILTPRDEYYTQQFVREHGESPVVGSCIPNFPDFEAVYDGKRWISIIEK